MPRGDAARPSAGTQDVRFCRAPDGVRIAYAVHGTGPPLVVNTCWLSHLQYDWQSPVYRHFLEELGRFATVIRYDERGYGLSDWDVSDLSFPTRVADLEAVVEAAGLERFALLGMSQGGPVAIAYAHRHRERVSRLVLYATHSTPARRPEDAELMDTFVQLMRVGWARPDALFRRVFTSTLIPNATEEQMRWIDELQRMSTSAETAAAALVERRKVDVTEILPELDLPCLVLVSRGDKTVNSLAEARLLASSIPAATLVPLESDNHILLADEAAWPVFMAEVTEFLAPDRRFSLSASLPADPLTGREVEVLRLAAEGLDNATIADRLTLSVRTVERHLSNAYLKLGVTGKTARTAAVAHILNR